MESIERKQSEYASIDVEYLFRLFSVHGCIIFLYLKSGAILNVWTALRGFSRGWAAGSARGSAGRPQEANTTISEQTEIWKREN